MTIVACVLTGSALGQSTRHDEALEQTIRKLEAAEANAILRGDVAALEKLWADDFTVNNPQNQISRGRKEVLDRVRSGLIKYSSFAREIESVRLYGDTVIVMGLEVVAPIGDAPGAGQALRRRFTNIWMKRNGKWLLTARHASVICQN
jgi:ketosteroid isomerase-like protein